MKQFRSIPTIAAAALAVFALYAVVHSQMQKRASAQRQATYQKSLRSYREQFHTGLTRLAVESSLRAQGVKFRAVCCNEGSFEDEVQVGKEPAPWFCNYNYVYIGLRFNGAPTSGIITPQPDDILRTIELTHQLGQCL